MDKMDNGKKDTEIVNVETEESWMKESVNEDEGENINIPELITQINKKIAELQKEEEEFALEEEKILKNIKETLKAHNLRYVYDPDRPKILEVGIVVENKPFRVQINLQNEKIIFRLIFPFRVQCNSLVLTALYIIHFNENRAFSKLNLNMDTGEISMDYTYLISKAETYNARHFWIYMTSLIYPSVEIYTKLSHLAVGKVLKAKTDYYKALIKKSQKLLDGKEEYEESIIYGDCEIKEFLAYNRKGDLLGRLRSSTLYDVPEDKDENISLTGGLKSILDKYESDRESKEDAEIIMPFEGLESSSTNKTDD